MESLDVKIQKKSDGMFYVSLYGPLDTYTHEEFDYHVGPLLVPETKVIVLDMEGVGYVSSMGIGSIFKIRQYANENNMELAMVNVQSQIQKVFDTVQAMPPEAIFKSVEEIDEYLDHIQKKAKE